MSDTFFRIVGFLFLIAGSYWMYVLIKHSFRCSLKVEATVKRVKKSPYYRRGVKKNLHQPSFAYKVKGKNYVTQAYISTPSETRYAVGTVMIIRCNPDHPEEICMPEHWTPLLWGMLLFSIGLILTICGFL